MSTTLLAVLVFAAPTVDAGGTEAVLMVSSPDQAAPLAALDALSSNLAAQFSRSPFLKSLVSGQDLRKMLDLEATKNAIACSDSDCLVQIAGALDVPILVSVIVGKVSDKMSLTVTVMDVENARALARRYELFDDIYALHAGVAGYGDQLSQKAFGLSVGQRLRSRRWLGWALMGLGTAVGAGNRWVRNEGEKPSLGLAITADVLSIGGLSWEVGAWFP